MQFWSELTPETRKRQWNKKGNVIYSSNLEKNFSKCRNDSLRSKIGLPQYDHCLFVGMTTKIIFKLVAF